MKSFEVWLEERDPEVHAEVFSRLGNIAKKAALIGGIGITAAGGVVDTARAAGMPVSPQTTRQDQQNRDAEAVARAQQQRKSVPLKQQAQVSGMNKH